ncbi:hypothetical protein MACK_003803 [Theileria orientalis]|uniref:Uncharacterized protein n=1 Tax=Theileria orientalis TaxID=68886 RepID=A0A976XJA8_THEOR|nr:hypothetical protein MACK_003803 [Theileria orientalis]
MTLSILETILGLMRNYIYKQTNYYHYFWLDRLSVSISKYLFNYRDQMIKLSLRSSDTLYNLNYQYLKVDSPRSKVLKDSTKYSDHEDIVNNYLLSRYNNSFYKLWSYLNCSHKLYSIYSCNHNFNPYGAKVNGEGDPNKEDKYYDEEDDYNELYNVVENYQIINCDNLMIPLIVPMRLFFYKLYYYSNHQLYLNNSTSTYTQPKDAKSKEKNKEELETDILMKKIIDNLRKIRFISLHNAKGRTMSTFYTMPNITMNDHVSHLSLQLLVDPIKSDLYLLTELNTRLSLHQLNSKMTSSVVNLLVDYNNGSSQQQREQPGENNWIILLKFLKYLDRYSTTFIEEIFHIKKSNLRISYSLQKLFRNRENTSNSGGIAPHPVWPLYAIVHGSTGEKTTPSYTVSLQHSRVLSNEFKYTKNNILLNNLINIVNVTSLQLTTFHSNNIFGDLLYIDWSGDSLCLYDKYGWLMVYYMRNLLYKNVNAVSGKVGKQVNDIIPSASIPTISFKTHFASYYMSWLGEYFILTMGYGILKESIDQDIVYINMSFKEDVEEAQVTEEYAEAENGQLNLTGSQFSNGVNGYVGQISSEYPTNGNETASYGAVHRCVGREAVSLQGLEGFCESSVPCICIWNLVEYNNNIPKINVLLSFESISGGSNASVGAVGSTRDTPMEESLRVTSVLKIKNRNIRHGSKEVGLEYDLLLFDSTGVMRVFSVSDMDVVFCCSLDESAIVASFLLSNGNFAVVTEDGKIKVFKLARPRAVPALIFETSSKVVEPKEIVSQSSLVTTIGEFISQRFTREKPQPAQQQIKIVSVRLYSAQFITIVYSDEQVSTTRLPDFAVY